MDVQTIRIEDGREFALRELRPDDLDALRRAFRRLTPDEVELRFMHLSRELPALVEDEMRTLDPARDAAFVLEDDIGIRAVADLHATTPDAGQAEFGLIVGKAIAGHGLGSLLLQQLLAEARRRGLALVGSVRRDNMRMLELCRALGGAMTPTPDDATLMEVRFA